LKGLRLVSTILVILILATLQNPVSIARGSRKDASWGMNQGSDTGTDLVGGSNGTLHGASWSPAAVVFNSSGSSWDLGTGVRGGLEFNGKDTYVEVPDSPHFRLENFSVAFWVLPDTSSDYVNVMGKQYSGAGQQAGWVVSLNNMLGEDNLTLMHLIVFGPSHTTTYSAGVPIDLAMWTHLVFTVDNRTIAAYKNGILVGKVASNGYLPTNEPLRIGKAYGDSHYFEGLVSEVQYYNSSLTETDVQDLYMSYATTKQHTTVIELNQIAMNQGQETPITAKLIDQLGRVLVGVQVSFYLNTHDRAGYLGTVTTDSRGYARIVSGPHDPGNYSLTAEFDGEGQYLGCAQTVEATVANSFPQQPQQVLFGTIGTIGIILFGVALVAKRRRLGWGSKLEFPSLPIELIPSSFIF
jgi:hypothetical protein